MKQYAIYLRKSREDKELEESEKGETLARHEKLLLEVSRQRGYNIGEIYREVVSGETISERPQMLRLLSDVGAGKWKGVIVTEVSRLARGNTSDQGLVVDSFSRSETLIITPNEVIDTTNDSDEDRLDMNLFMSRFEYKIIKRRMMRGRTASFNEGKYIGSTAPYGYQRVKLNNQKGWTLEIVPEEAEIVRMAFNIYAKENGCVSTIATQLTEMGAATRKGGLWTPNSIRQMLKNPVYDGKVWWGKRNPKKRNEHPATIIEGLHDAIITGDIYKTVQLRFAERPTPPTRTLKNPLAGLIYCADCGSVMLRLPYTGGARPDQLYCRTKGCTNISSYLEIVEKSVMTSLERWLVQYKLDLSRHEKGQVNPQHQVMKQSLIAIESEEKALNSQLENAYDLLEQGIYTTEIFLERNKKLTDKINANEIRHTKILKDIKRTNQAQGLQMLIIPAIENVLSCYDKQSDVKIKNDLLKEVIEKIEYKKVHGYVAPDDFEIKLYPRTPCL